MKMSQPLANKMGALSRNHFNFRVGFHDLLDAGQGKLVQFVVMFVRLELGNLLLPIGIKNVAVVALEALVHLTLLAFPDANFGLTVFVHSATSR